MFGSRICKYAEKKSTDYLKLDTLSFEILAKKNGPSKILRPPAVLEETQLRGEFWEARARVAPAAAPSANPVHRSARSRSHTRASAGTPEGIVSENKTLFVMPSVF